MATKVKVNFDPIRSLDRLGLPDGARMFLANEIVRISDPFVPFDTGALKSSARVLNGGRQISYGGNMSRKYARRMWYGDGYNFVGAPIRGSRWVDRAVATNHQQIISAMQRKLSSGGFK